MMSPSSTLANRSFLYGGGGGGGGKPIGIENRQQATAASCLIGDKIVYATLDSLALSRKSLPLSSVEITEEDQPEKRSSGNGRRQQQPRASPIVKLLPEVGPPKPSSLETKLLNLPAAFDNESDSGSSGYNKSSSSSNSIYGSYVSPKYSHPSLRPKPQKDVKVGKAGKAGEKKERREFSFAKNVLHYVPMSSRRYYRKSRKSLSSAGNNNERTLKSRSLSRDELKYVTISQPSNFVHVASATRKSLMAENSVRRPHIRHELDYDDVGPPAESQDSSSESKNLQEDDAEPDAYDDVGPYGGTSLLAKEDEAKPADDQQLYDDVMPLHRSSSYDQIPEEDQPDEDVYDDVGLPTLPTQSSSQESHERVNSLYAGSSIAESIQMAYSHYYDKESEWEDEEAELYGLESGQKIGGEHLHSSKKKLPGQAQQRWSRKLRRQRSKASRKSSGRSASRTRAKSSQVNSENVYDSSDDSNYETLQTYEPDDFSSDSDTETPNPAVHPTLQEPPSRPIPPPPRESSLLGHTLGRRIKMLRRSWIITKGSLGRMRRRASADGEPSAAQLVGNSSSSSSSGAAGAAADNRKYFCSFKKHFRKSSASGLSTFYLDKGSGSDGQKESESEKRKSREEPIYANGNWYREVGLYREEPEPTKVEDQAAIDHYSVLAEEPLYQFYALDATRVAFESDSDGYEEVEELAPSSATTDLAKPGHRTLWCQTPQVINSGLLQSLSMEERKLQEAKFEILTSEASYLNSLRVLENEFASNQELVQEILTSAERDKLFGMVPDVLVASERFLAELESIWREDPMLLKLPELLLKHGDKSCQVYVDYCSNQVSIDTTLKELRANKAYKFLETVSRIEMRPACQSLSLHSFLMLPMQRITRLPLLADAVLSKLSLEHSERLSWQRVLTALSDVVGKCNEGARLAERRNEMDALARKLDYSPKVAPITLHDRELIRSGTVVHLASKHDTEYKLTFGKKFQKTPLMLLLLTDYLLVTKLKSNSNEETFSVIETCKRSMLALESAPEDSPFAGRHAMVLTLLENHAGRQVEYVLTCENDTEKERWLDAVSPPKPTCLGETLYESWDCPQVMVLHSYAPVQPDELTLQPGDVINVLRKMNDGWLFGEKLLDGEQGWFPGNFTKEVASEHVRARNLRQRHRFLALSGSVLQRRAKQSLSLL